MRKFRRRAYVKALNTSNRVANEGDRVVIVKPIYTEKFSEHRIGEVYEVKDVFKGSIYTTTGLGLWDSEYRVIEDRKEAEVGKVEEGIKEKVGAKGIEYRKMTEEDYKKLSDAQRKVLEDMRESQLMLVYSEGEEYSVWLESREGEKVRNVNRSTGRALLNTGALKTRAVYKSDSKNTYFVVTYKYKELARK